MPTKSTITDRTALKAKFDAHVTNSDNDCRVWVGTKQIRVGDQFLTPRRAAWLLKFGELPEGEIRLKCMTANCVFWRHLEEGAARNAGARAASERLSQKQIAQISASDESIPTLAKKYKVSVGTIHRYKNEKGEKL